MTGPERLVCGAAPDDLVAQVADGKGDALSAHQAGCPHCQAALTEYRRLWAPVLDLVDEPVAVPDGILEHVLNAIRAAGEHPGYGVIPGPSGITRISDRVVAVTARISAERVPGVRAALSRDGDGRPGSRPGGAEAVAGTHGTSAVIRLTVAVSYGQDLVALARRIRAAVAASIRTLTGLEPADIAIVIDDVLELPTGS